VEAKQKKYCCKITGKLKDSITNAEEDWSSTFKKGSYFLSNRTNLA